MFFCFTAAYLSHCAYGSNWKTFNLTFDTSSQTNLSNNTSVTGAQSTTQPRNVSFNTTHPTRATVTIHTETSLSSSQSLTTSQSTIPSKNVSVTTDQPTSILTRASFTTTQLINPMITPFLTKKQPTTDTSSQQHTCDSTE